MNKSFSLHNQIDKEVNFMQISNEIHNVLKNMQVFLNKMLISNSKEQLESFLYLMAKRSD